MALSVSSSLLQSLAIGALAVVTLWLGARTLVAGASRLARRAGVPELVVGLTVVAVGTSAPELAVTVDAALAGRGDVAVGNVVGSNVYNLAFVLGAVATIRTIAVEPALLRRDTAVLGVSTLALGVVLRDLAVSHVEAAVLVAGLVAYYAVLARAAYAGAADIGAADRPADRPVEPAVGNPDGSPAADAVRVAVGLALVVVGGHALVEAAVTVARTAGVSEWVIGATVVAAGTSLPEFAVSALAARRGQVGVSAGNLVGSNVFNVLGVLGIAGLVRPLAVSPTAVLDYAWLVGVVAVVVALLWTGRALSRREGVVLLASEVARWTIDLFG